MSTPEESSAASSMHAGGDVSEQVSSAEMSYSEGGLDELFAESGFSSIEPPADYLDDAASTTMMPTMAAGPSASRTMSAATYRSASWHGGADFGLFVLRLVLGGTLIVHGLQTFGLFHGPGVHAAAAVIAQSGYRASTVLAWVTGIAEVGGGALLVLGLFTPLAAAGPIGIMANAIVLKWTSGGGYFLPSGFEYELMIAAAAFALLFAGPGRASLDRPMPWYRHPVLNGWIFLIIAAAATTGVWFGLH